MLETKVKIIHDDPSRFEARESYYPWPFGGPGGLFDFLLIPFRLIWLLTTGSRRITIDTGNREIVILHGHFGIGFCRHIRFSDIRAIKLATSTMRKRSDLPLYNKKPTSHTVVMSVPRSGVRVFNVPTYQHSSTSDHTEFRPDIPLILDELTISLSEGTSLRLLTAMHGNASLSRTAVLLSRKTGFTIEATDDQQQ